MKEVRLMMVRIMMIMIAGTAADDSWSCEPVVEAGSTL